MPRISCVEDILLALPLNYDDPYCTSPSPNIVDFTGVVHLSQYIYPAGPQVYRSRAVIYSKMGKYQRAIEDYDETIRIDPKNARAYNSRGFIHYIHGHNERAVEDWRKACELGDCKLLNWAKAKRLPVQSSSW